MSNAATPSTPHRAPWWFAPALLTAVILVVVALQLVRQDASHADAPCEAPVTTRDDLPGGAVSVRLCEYGMPALDAWPSHPADVLTENVAAVIDAYHAQNPEAPEVCTADGGANFALEFRYTGREPIRIVGALFGCHDVGGRRGAEAVLAAFVDALRAQRSHRPIRPNAVPAPTCREPDLPSTYITAQPAELTQAVFCVPASQPGRLWHQVIPSAADWETIRADLVANSHPVDPLGIWDDECRPTARYLIGANAHGDLVIIDLTCIGVGRWWVGGGPWPAETMRWQQSPAVRAMIERLGR